MLECAATTNWFETLRSSAAVLASGIPMPFMIFGPATRVSSCAVRPSAAPALEGGTGKWGLIPFFSKDGKPKSTFNARSETAVRKPTFRDPWKRGQRCIIPASAVFEPDWRGGKAIATRIEHVEAELLAIAGLWSSWRWPSGERIESYTMPTLNANEHLLMRNFHKPDHEKWMVAVLTEATQDDWLDAPREKAVQLITPYPAERLIAQAAPR